MLNRLPVILLALSLTASCKPSGSPTTKATSAKFQTLQEKSAFLHQYVSFRRTYTTLDFDIEYHNNSGGLVPGPSGWDIRLIATVPASELNAWIPSGVKPSTTPPDLTWLKSIPTSLNAAAISEWYDDGHRRIVGVDRTNNLVAYRLWKL